MRQIHITQTISGQRFLTSGFKSSTYSDPHHYICISASLSLSDVSVEVKSCLTFDLVTDRPLETLRLRIDGKAGPSRVSEDEF